MVSSWAFEPDFLVEEGTAPMRRWLVLLFAFGLVCPAMGRDLFVSPDGTDGGPGTRQQPFRTIQRAIDALQPGDTCFVCEGTYREQITFSRGGLPGRPIRLRAYPGHRVILDGTEPVRGPWTEEQGGVFSAPSALKIEQLFAEERMLVEARWPNCPPERMLTRDGWAETGPESVYGTLQSAELARTGVDWNGAMAMLNVAHQFWSWSRTVEGYVPGSDKLPYTITMNPFHYENRRWWDDDFFYLVGKREALDAEGEWSLAGGVLSLMLPRGARPETLGLRAKQRDYAVSAAEVRFVEISGFHFFGCTFQLADCEDCLIEYCNLLYPSYARGVPNAEEDGKRRPCPGTNVSGRRNTIRSCSFEHCPNYGVVLLGERNVIENSIVHDVNWPGTLHYTAVALRGGEGAERPANAARHNTLYNVGNAIVACSGPDSIVEYNHVHHGGLISADVSLLYTSMPSADGMEFRYNWVHDSLSPNHSLGIRGDDKTRGLHVHHNVIWNVAKDGIVTKGGRNRVYNNTCLANGAADIMFNSGPEPDKWWQKHVKAYQNQNEDSLLINNCAQAIVSTRRRVQSSLPGDHSNNYVEPDPMLVDPKAFDFRPRPGSPLIDAGRAVNGVTAPYVGEAPDIGAYEFGGEPWLPGHRNGIWLARNETDATVRLNLPILEPVVVRLLRDGSQIAKLTFTPENWVVPQPLPSQVVEPGSLTFETDAWGRAVVDGIENGETPLDIRAMFERPDIASARIVDSKAKFDYEDRYDADPAVRPAYRAFHTERQPTVDGRIGKDEWPGWNRTRCVPLASLAEDGVSHLPAAAGYALFDDSKLFLAVRVAPSERQNGKEETAAKGDFLQLDVARVAGRHVAQPISLRAYPSGQFEQIGEEVRQPTPGIAFAAREEASGGWNAEFCIPLAALGLAEGKAAELRFNLGLQRESSPGGPRFAAARPQHTKQPFAEAAVLWIDPAIEADAVNLVRSGSFDTSELSPWRLSSNSGAALPADAVAQVDRGQWQDGCIQIQAKDPEAMKTRVIKWTYPVGDAVAAPGRYCLSYSVRVVGEGLVPCHEMGSFNSYVHVRQKGRPGGNLGQRPSMLTTTGDRWIRSDLIVNVPPGVSPSMISLQLHQATGTVLLDNISLVRCE